MHYSDDDDQLPDSPSAGDDDDDLVGPRRGGPPPAGYDDDDDDDLVGRRRPSAGRSAGAAGDADDDEGGLAGPRRGPRRSILDDDDEDGTAVRAPLRTRGRGRRRGGDHPSLPAVLREIPAFLRLLTGLARDRRVSKLDKAIVAAVLVYLVSPVDLIPDFVVPVLGQLEDVYFLVLALTRLVNNAGMDVLLDHWEGDMATLEAALDALDSAADLLPGPVRGLLGQRPA